MAICLGLAMLLSFFAVHFLLDDARLKQAAISAARSSLERELKLGELTIRLRPFPALALQDVALSNPEWADAGNLLEVQRIDARLKLLPLLKRQVVISSLSLQGVKLNLEVSPKGEKSWDFGASDQDRDKRNPGSAIPEFDPRSIKSVTIENAEINRSNGAGAKATWVVDALDAHGEQGWKNVAFASRIIRNSQPMQIEGEIADLSRLGTPGQVSEGKLKISWDRAQLELAGLIPLHTDLKGHRVTAGFEAESLSGLLGFFSKPDVSTAKITATAQLHHEKALNHIEQLAVVLGKHRIKGDGSLDLSGTKPAFAASLTTEYIDWALAMKDLGRPQPPPKPEGQLFHDRALPWGLLLAMKGWEGKADLRIDRLKLRSGIELSQLTAGLTVDDDKAEVQAFSFSMLDGSAKGNMKLHGQKKNVQLNLNAQNISLGKWLAARAHRLDMTGGPMKIVATVSASGASMKNLAATLNGSVKIDIGAAKLRSQKIQQAETLLTGLLPMLSVKDADQVEIACISAALPFRNGQAQAEPLIGLRSDASQLLTSGHIDLKEQTLDLRGRVRARSGISLGVSTLAGGNIQIAGKILQPEVAMDPAAAPGMLARLGAAIMTGGASILATAAWDAANPATNPCRIVAEQSAFAGRGKR